MAKNTQDFRDELIKMANAVEFLENSFIGNQKIEIKVSVDNNTFTDISNYLGSNPNENKCVVSISNTEFIFLKK
jgi:hypothetical protein